MGPPIYRPKMPERTETDGLPGMEIPTRSGKWKIPAAVITAALALLGGATGASELKSDIKDVEKRVREAEISNAQIDGRLRAIEGKLDLLISRFVIPFPFGGDAPRPNPSRRRYKPLPPPSPPSEPGTPE